MRAIDWVIAIGFGVPIVGLSALFVSEARRMMRLGAEREKVRRSSAQARRHEAMRRRARGTPRRPGSAVIR